MDETPRGLFVVFEGGDGVGKSTQAGLLSDWLRGRGEQVVTTFEPGDSAVGRRIRSILLDPGTGDLDARAETLLYAADKAHHVSTVIRPAMAAGAIVVCDRYVDSMLAYQGAGRVLDPADLEWVARWATGELRPDLTVLLDLDPDIGVGGIRTKDRLEGAGSDFHRRARAFFLQLAEREPERYLVLPARTSKAGITQAVRERLEPLLSARAARM